MIDALISFVIGLPIPIESRFLFGPKFKKYEPVGMHFRIELLHSYKDSNSDLLDFFADKWNYLMSIFDR